MVAASGWSDASATRMSFRRALRTAQELAQLLQEADEKLSDVISALIHREMKKTRNGQE